MKKKNVFLAAVIASLTLLAFSASAAGWSDMYGGVLGGAGFSGTGMAGSSGSYYGDAGSVTSTGYTDVQVGGGINTFTAGHGSGNTAADSSSGGFASVNHGSVNSSSWSQVGSSASTSGNVFSGAYGSAGAGAGAGSGGQ